MLPQDSSSIAVSKPQRHLLLVDDEEGILQSLRRLLRRDGYQIHLASSGQEGLAILEREPIGVIVTDQRMPVMTGSEFLSKVKECYPDTVRIVLSGYTELNSIAEAINQGAIYKFLTKPWDDDLLREHIREAFERFEMKEENTRLASLNQAMIDAVPDALLLVDVAQRHIISANATAHELLGYPANGLIQKTIDEIEPLPADQFYWDEIRESGFRPLQLSETEYQSIEGELIPVRKSTVKVAGSVFYVLVLVEDIRRERAIESSLERINAEMASIFEATSDGLLVLDAMGNLVRMNRRLNRIWSFPADMLSASASRDVLCWIASQSSTPAETEAELLASVSQPEERVSSSFQRNNGESVTWYANPMLIKDSINGQVFGFSISVPAEVWTT